MNAARNILLALVTVACGTAWSANQVQVPTGQERVAEIKNEIRKVAKNADGLSTAEQRAALDPLISELSVIYAANPVADYSVALQGSWRPIWTDLAISDDGNVADMYEVILPNNVLYHTNADMLVRADYELNDATYSFTYTKAVLATDAIVQGANLVEIANQAEAGTFDANPVDFSNGQSPIGKKMTATHVFIDEDMRILFGTNEADGTLGYLVMDRAANVGDSIPVEQMPEQPAPQQPTPQQPTPEQPDPQQPPQQPLPPAPVFWNPGW